MLNYTKKNSHQELATEILLIKAYRFPIMFLLSTIFALLLPLEVVLRFTFVVPYYAWTSPSHKVKHRMRKHSKLRSLKMIHGLIWWMHNEDEFPWRYLT